ALIDECGEPPVQWEQLAAELVLLRREISRFADRQPAHLEQSLRRRPRGGADRRSSSWAVRPWMIVAIVTLLTPDSRLLFAVALLSLRVRVGSGRAQFMPRGVLR